MNVKTKRHGAFIAPSTPTKPADSTNTTSSGDPKTPNTSKPAEARPSSSVENVMTAQPMTDVLRSAYGNLPDEVVDQCIKAERLIRKAVDFTRNYHPSELYAGAQQLLAFQSWILKYQMVAEQAYREKIAAGKRSGESIAAAEAEAKTTPEYRAYKYLDYFYDLCTDQVNLSKKFSDKMDDEMSPRINRP